MKTTRTFKQLFLYALVPQLVACILVLAFGMGIDTTYFNLMAIFYAPVVFALSPLVKLSNSWAAIGLFTFCFPLIGAILYSWLFAAIATPITRRRNVGHALDG